MNLPTKIFGGFTIVILLCIMLTYINRGLSDKVDSNMEKLARSEEILKISSDFQRHIVDMETGCRGFLLGDHKEFLDEYYKSNADIPAILQEASELVKNNPVQDGKLNYIAERLDKWQKNFAEPLIEAKKNAIAAYDNVAVNKAYERLINLKVKPKYDKYLMDDIKAAFSGFDAAEYKIRKADRQQLANSISDTKKISLYVTGFCVAFGLLLALFITLHIAGRVDKMMQMASNISENNFTNRLEDNSADELGKLAASLNSMSGRLDKSFAELQRINAELDRFILLASHDIKEPLRMISIYTQLLLRSCDGRLDDKENEYANYVMEGAHRIHALIHDLVKYTQAGQHNIHYENINCQELINSIESKLRKKMNEAGAQLVYQNLPVITSDGSLLSQLMENLIDNAIKFRKEDHAQIKINVLRRNGEWLFSIHDDGIGIDHRYEDKIFSVFQRLHERQKYEGTGIGLALCKKIIELHGGRIWFESNPGEGTTFYFTLPIPEKKVVAAPKPESRFVLAHLFHF